MLISQQAAADELGITRQAFNNKIRWYKEKNGKHYGFLQKNKHKVLKVENEHPEYLALKMEYAAKGAALEMRKRASGKGKDRETRSAESEELKKKRLKKKNSEKKNARHGIRRWFLQVWKWLMSKCRNYIDNRE